ncbi:MAG: helix-turn-helix domain-containing protein [Verrucomicrobia bacterium]|nr:helix-turn-helix domain-containing protein [Verrucomicrobiota bacterium]
MVIDAKKMGAIFRTRREERNLSLKEVESSTSIRTTYLQAIEEGSIDKLLSTVYMYGFTRQYALYLNLDMEKIVKEYPELFKLPKETPEFAYGIGTLESRSSMHRGQRLPKMLWVGVGVVLLLLLFWLGKALGVL